MDLADHTSSNSRIRRRFVAALAFSAAAHAAVLANLPAPTKAAALDSPLAITLTLNHGAPAAPMAKQPPHTGQPSRPPGREPKRAPPELPSDTRTATVVADTAPAPGSANPPTAVADNAVPDPAPTFATDVFAQDLHAALERYFRYPLLARRRGLEGEVLLGCRLNPDGTLSDLAVLRSSGHTVLDQAALAALSRVGALPRRPAAMLFLELPVTYRIIES